jgi:tetratricopeptide (TPR) repeat protein
MPVYKSPGDVRLLAILISLLALAACGQQQQPDATTTVEEAALPDKVPVTTDSGAARTLYDEGLSLADNLHFLEANQAFARAVEVDPGFAMGYFRLAQSSQTAAAFFKAVGQAEDNAKNVSEGEQLYIRALIAGAENDQEMQFEYLVALMSMYPRDERTHMQVANYFTGQQNFADAIKHYGHATAINPGFSAAYNALGYAYRNNENLPEARKAFARYVALIPDEANPYDSYAELLLEMGEYEESIDNYRKAIEINPNFLSAYAGITIAESLQGNAEAAQAAAAEMLAAARNSGQRQAAMFRAVTSHLFAGSLDAALAVSEERLAVAEAAGNHTAMGGIHEYMGDIVVVTGDSAGALAHYASALAHRQQSNLNDANKAQAERAYLFKAAVAAMVTGDHDTLASRAADYTAAVEEAGSAFERLRIPELAGYVAAVNEDYASSAAELAQANQLNPIVLYWSAMANAGIGNTEQARDLASRAAYRNVLSPNLPFFRQQALQLLADLEAD